MEMMGKRHVWPMPIFALQTIDGVQKTKAASFVLPALQSYHFGTVPSRLPPHRQLEFPRARTKNVR